MFVRKASVLVILICIVLARQPLGAQPRELVAPASASFAASELVPAEQVSLFLRHETFLGLDVEQVLLDNGLRPMPDVPATFLDAEKSTLLMAAEPLHDNEGAPLLVVVSVAEGTAIPLLLDFGSSRPDSVDVEVLGTDIAARVTSRNGELHYETRTPYRERQAPGRHRLAGDARPDEISADAVSDKIKCVIDQFAFSGEFLCAVGEYLFCVATAQFPTTSAGALVGCARPIIKALRKDAKKEKSWCATAVNLAKCLTEGGGTSKPSVTIDSVKTSGSRISIKASASDRDGNLRAISIYQTSGGSSQLLNASPASDCTVEKSGSRATCSAEYDAGTSATSVDIEVYADDASGLSANNGVSVPLRFTISGNAGVANAAVQVGSVTTQANSKGEYSVKNLAPGTYTIKPSKAKCTFTPSSDTATVGPHATKSFKAS